MFSGIVVGSFPVSEADRSSGLLRIAVTLPESLTSKIGVGASVAVDGVCLTATEVTSSEVRFDVIPETVRVTTLRDIQRGDIVNIEPSITAHQDISGHIVSGHVDDVVLIDSIDRPDGHTCTITFSVGEEWMKYIFPKGFVSLNGCSLTVGHVDRKNCRFCVYLIPETLKRTTFAHKQVGDAVNLEVERQTQAVVDTINVFLERLETKILNGQGSAAVQSLLPLLREARS